MENQNHVSTEAERRAYQVAQNIIRRNIYLKQLEELEQMKLRFTREFLSNHKEHKIDHLILAINAGTFALSAGNSYEQASSYAVARLQELAQ